MRSFLRDLFSGVHWVQVLTWAFIAACPLYVSGLALKIFWSLLLFVHFIIAFANGRTIGKREARSELLAQHPPLMFNPNPAPNFDNFDNVQDFMNALEAELYEEPEDLPLHMQEGEDD